MLENSMLIDSLWTHVEPVTVEPVNGECGFLNIWTGEFIPDCEALDYAMEHEEKGNMTNEEFVDWFFSENWIRTENEEYGTENNKSYVTGEGNI